MTASDGIASVTDDFVLTVSETNRDPVITSTPNLTGVTGALYSYQVASTDPDGDPRSYALAISPEGMQIDATTGLITWLPTEFQAGSAFTEVLVTDGHGGEDRQSFTIDMAQGNRTPIITTTTIGYAVEETAYTYDVDATDPDNDTLEYALVQAPTGMTINSASGVLAWTPTSAQVGTHEVEVVVEDPSGASDTQLYGIVVADSNASGGGSGGGGLPGPVASQITPEDGTKIAVPVSVSAELEPPAGTTVDTWTVSIRHDADDPWQQLASGNGANVTAAIDPTVLPNGLYSVAIDATSSDGGSSHTELGVIVDGGFKPGRFTVTFEDLKVESSGLAVQDRRRRLRRRDLRAPGHAVVVLRRRGPAGRQARVLRRGTQGAVPRAG